MRNNESIIAYMINNFWYLLLISLVPSVFVSLFFYSEFSPIMFFQNFLSDIDGFKVTNSFLDVYRYFSVIDYSNWIWWTLSAIVFLLAFTVMFVVVETHMRLGVRTKRGFFKLINDSLLIIVKYMLLALAVAELAALIISGIIVISSLIFSSIGVFFVSLIISILMLVVLLLLLTSTICVVPIVLADGYNLRFAMSYSISMISPRLAILFGEVVVGLVVSSAISYLIGLLGGIFIYAASVLLTMVILVFIPVFSVRNYMRITQSERRDIRKTSY